MKTRQVLGFILFAAFLLISIIEITLYLRAGTLTTLEQIAAMLDISTKLGFVSKLLIICMFGVLLIPEEQK